MYNIRDIVYCYDPRIWNKRGYDLNNNEDCWKEAVIINIRRDVKCCENTDNEHIHDILYDVNFLYDNFISKGHFETSIKKVEKN